MDAQSDESLRRPQIYEYTFPYGAAEVPYIQGFQFSLKLFNLQHIPCFQRKLIILVKVLFTLRFEGMIKSGLVDEFDAYFLKAVN